MSQRASKAIIRDRVIIIVLPILVSVVAFKIIYYLCNEYKFIISIQDGLDDVKTMLGIWGTMLGFLITAVSILLALNDGKFLDMMKKTGHYKTVLLAYIVCCIHLFVATVLAIICIFIKMWSMKLFAVLCALVIDTMLLIAICLLFLFILVVRVNE